MKFIVYEVLNNERCFMFQIAYMSFMSKNFDPKNKDLVESILHTARENNARLGVTGMLIFQDGVFFQLLEGEKDVVLNLYGRICSDLRHQFQRVLVKQESNSRVFGNWSMGFHDSSKLTRDQLLMLKAWKEMRNDTQEGKEVSPDKIWEFFATLRFGLDASDIAA